MGRPIKKKFFGSLTTPYQNHETGGRTGVGAEGVASVTLSTSSLAVSTLTIVMSFSVPQIAGGITATGTPVKTGNTVTSVTINTAGSGYTSAPTVTFTGTNMTTQGAGTAVLTTSTQDTIQIISFLTTGSSAVSNGDIMKQEASKRYLVQNSQGQGQCKLVTTSTLTAGTMAIIATDYNGSTYFVKKLTARKAVLVQSTASTAFLVANGASTGWNVGSATGTIVTIANTI
jgi:hypothetical protein